MAVAGIEPVCFDTCPTLIAMCVCVGVFVCRKRSKRSGVELEEETISPHTHPDTVGGALHSQWEGEQRTVGREEGEGVSETPRKKYHLNRSSTVATPTTREGTHTHIPTP